MHHALLRVPILIFNMWLGYKGGKSPNPPPKVQEQVKFQADERTKDFFSRIAWWYTPFGMVLLQLGVIMDIYVIVSTIYPSLQIQSINSLGYFTPSPAAFERIRASPSFIFGFLMLATGTIIRVACYRALGKQFTYELSVRRDDKLITHGPYKLVRHPSYTGVLFFLDGALICQMSSGSWWAENGLWDTTFGKVYGITLLIFAASCEWSMISRTWKEDQVMKEVHKSQWEAWAKQTPHRMVPGIF
ncbi:unnamed protein product [Somion occarium]|uniref:Protein-S-isoprenylcysteine O-methyltransferase n=1 Tax=Somion occarium TaxID=3059160 RepID=A0ABP1D9Y3_9APHY